MSLAAEQSRRQARLLAVLVVILVAAGLYMYVFTPQQRRLDEAKEGLESARTELEISLVKLRNANDAQANLESAIARLVNAYERISDEDRTSYVLRDLQSLATKYGVAVSNVSFTDRKPIGRFLEVPFTVDVTGTFDDAVGFVEELGRLTRIVTVRSYKLSSGASMPGAESEGEGDGGGVPTDANYVNLTLQLSTYARPKGGEQVEPIKANPTGK